MARDLHEGKDQTKKDGNGIGDAHNEQAQEPAGHQREERRDQKLRLEEHAQEGIGVPGCDCGAGIKVGHECLKRRVGNGRDGLGIRQGLRAGGVLVGTAHDDVAARIGEAHALDLKANEEPLANGLREHHGQLVVGRGRHTFDARAGKAFKGRHLGGRTGKRASLRQGERDRRHLLALIDGTLPCKARRKAANDAGAAVLVGARGRLVGGKCEGARRSCERKDERQGGKRRGAHPSPLLFEETHLSPSMKHVTRSPGFWQGLRRLSS